MNIYKIQIRDDGTIFGVQKIPTHRTNPKEDIRDDAFWIDGIEVPEELGVWFENNFDEAVATKRFDFYLESFVDVDDKEGKLLLINKEKEDLMSVRLAEKELDDIIAEVQRNDIKKRLGIPTPDEDLTDKKKRAKELTDIISSKKV